MRLPVSTRAGQTATWVLTTVAVLSAASIASCSSHSRPPGSRQAGPVRQITYHVDGHGTAAITWPGGSEPHADLPWHITTRAHVTTTPRLTVVLGPHTTEAACTIAADGRTVAGSHATGARGRAVCQAPALTAHPADG